MLNENLIIKDWRKIDLTLGLVYPNTYKIGMSSYAIRLLYFLLNSYENIACERFFLPENVKYPYFKYYTEKDRLRSIESKVLMEDFDILGFSIQFENDYKNVLWILDSASIPNVSVRQEERRKKGTQYPLIIGGGPVATSNPIPFSNKFDIFFIGDSEPNIDAFLQLFLKYKSEKLAFDDLLKHATNIEGLFVPTLKNQVSRSVLHNLDDSKIPTFQVMSESINGKSIFERNFFIEINRGCPYQCKFCITSYHNSPFRNRSYDKIIDVIDNGIKNSPFEKISLIGSCVSAHPKFHEICRYLIDKGIEISIPSIRIEYLSSKIIKLLESGSIKTITIAPETGSESLRFALGKQIPNEKIYSIVKEIKDSTIRNIKFYFLIGLPNEEERDVEETINMIKTINDFGFDKGTLKINFNPLIPKLNTPYENKTDHFLSENLYKLNQGYRRIMNELKNLPSIRLKFKNIKNLINMARLQALISTGDGDITSLLTNYYREGANFGALRRAEKLCDFTLDDYFRKIMSGYIPWKI
jgi:radical SAM superfamily enzyme YgiQ (UPF0313 family)